MSVPVVQQSAGSLIQSINGQLAEWKTKGAHVLGSLTLQTVPPMHRPVVAVMAVGGKEPTAGWLDHINARSGVRGSVGFITAAKGAATDAAVLAWLRGVAGQTPAAGQDLLLVTDDDKVLMALVNDIRSGAVRLTGSDAGLN
jgi:hypothetical protein